MSRRIVSIVLPSLISLAEAKTGNVEIMMRYAVNIPLHSEVSEPDARTTVDYILSLRE